MDIEHVDHIVDMRRYQVLIESNFPSEAGVMLRNLENKGNPWGAPPNTREDWTKGLDFEVPRVGRGDDFEYLFWVAKLPTYYVMDLAKDMAATVAEEMPSAAEIAANQWLPDSELAFYSAEYARTGFQGGLQWYRCGTSGAFTPELQTWSGRTIDVPSAFISGKQDWGTYQRPGVYEAMQSKALTNMIGCHLVEGAGHWVQQEQPGEVSRLLVQFLQEATAKAKTKAN